MAAKKSSTVKPVKMFEISGPYVIKAVKAKNTRLLDMDQSAFWNHGPAHLRKKIGCYVFGIRASKGIRPVYVGKTWRAFEKEAFGPYQINQYNAELAEIAKGAPVMFFVEYPAGKGATNKKMIRDIEQFLIQVAVAKNPNLRNVQNSGPKKWGITGILRTGKGTSSKSSQKFKKALSIHPSQI